jgi:hypothetical protein
LPGRISAFPAGAERKIGEEYQALLAEKAEVILKEISGLNFFS